MMINNDVISKIVKIGSVVTTTLLSFIIKPPIIDTEYNESVHWNSLYIFIAGVLTILLHDKLSNNKNIKNKSFGLLISLITLIVAYGFLSNQYSRKCEYDLGKQERFVISYSENFKNKEIKGIFQSWKKHTNNIDTAIDETLRVKNCNPSEIWASSALYIPFLGFILLYLLINVSLIILIISISEKVLNFNEKI